MKEEKIKDYGWGRGEVSEGKVFEALEELKAEGMIKNFGQSLKFYREDTLGRDFLITTRDDKIIWLQVKSGFNQFEKEKYRRRGIHYLGGVERKALEEIKKEILEILRQKSKGGKKEKIELKI